MRLRKGLVIVLLGLLAGGSVACKEEGPGEKFGRQLDEATEDVGDAFGDAADELEDAADEAKKKLE